MIKFIKIFTTFCVLQCLFLSNIIANEIKIKVGGSFNFRGAITDPDKTKYEKDTEIIVTNHNEHFGFLSDGNIFIDVSSEITEEISYGAKMSVMATTRNNRKAPSFLYFTSQIGKMEFGSNETAFKTMGISGYSNSCSASFSEWIQLNTHKPDIKYVNSPINFLDSQMRTKDQTEYARKITFYTPELFGLQAGITYIPDLSNTGYGLPGDKTYYEIIHYFYKDKNDSSVKKVPYYLSVKDGISGGISYKKKFDNDIEVKLAAVLEKGNIKIKKRDKINDIGKNIANSMSDEDIKKYQGAKFTDLMNYMVGGEVKFKDFSFALSYTNAGDSFTSNDLDGTNNKSDWFIFGGKYNLNDLGTSISYFTSDSKKNKFNAITFALDYKLSQGLTPYAEFTKYNTDGIVQTDPTTKDTQNGSVFIIGAKLAF